MEGENRFAMMQIESARTVGRELKERLGTEQNRHEVDIGIYRQQASRAEEALGAARMELAELKGRYDGLEARFAERQERIKGIGRRSSAIAKQAVKIRSLRR